MAFGLYWHGVAANGMTALDFWKELYDDEESYTHIRYGDCSHTNVFNVSLWKMLMINHGSSVILVRPHGSMLSGAD